MRLGSQQVRVGPGASIQVYSSELRSDLCQNLATHPSERRNLGRLERRDPK